MFAQPRPKKSPLPPPPKKRKVESAIEEISFDNDARQEYLTGFHKRKQQRIKLAQEEAAKKARQEKLETRRQMREERRKDAEAHVAKVNQMLKESGAIPNDDDEEGEGNDDESSDNWEGFPDKPDLEIVDHEEEYIDEDRYTTVTVETVAVTRDGFDRPGVNDEDEDENSKEGKDEDETGGKIDSKLKRPKKKQPKFRYESKFDRQMTDRKQRAKNKSKRRP